MFKKVYTMVIDNDQTSENFRTFVTCVSRCSNIMKITDNAEKGWTVIKTEATRHQWQTLIGMLNKKLNVTPYKIEGVWFI